MNSQHGFAQFQPFLHGKCQLPVGGSAAGRLEANDYKIVLFA
jgi:hypothetical protein